jgi:hypothetical protein
MRKQALSSRTYARCIPAAFRYNKSLTQADVSGMSVDSRNSAVRGYVLSVWSFGVLLESYLTSLPSDRALQLQLRDDAADTSVAFVSWSADGTVAPFDSAGGDGSRTVR